MGEGKALESRVADLEAENARLRELVGLDRLDRSQQALPHEPTLFGPDAPTADVDDDSSIADKVALFCAFFAGREDVYALRWDNPRSQKSGWGPAVRGGWANA